jgi:hypothetical protein
MTRTARGRTFRVMTLSDARDRLSATHQLALRCLADGDDDLQAAERLGVPLGKVTEVVAAAGAALHRTLTTGP